MSAEVGAGSSKPTPTIQSSYVEYQKLAGRWEPGEAWSFGGSVRLLHDFPASAVPGTTLKSGGDWVWSATADADFDVTKHLTLEASATGSPPSSRAIASTVVLPGAGSANALFDTKSMYFGGTLGVTYDTFDEDDPDPRAFDLAVDASVGYTRYSSTQTLLTLDTPAGPTAADTLVSRCQGAQATTPRCQVEDAAARGSLGQLDQWRLGATFTGTIAEDTDVAVDAAYFVYAQRDPASAGFFDVGTRGGAATYGDGMPLLAPRWSLLPEVAHRWKALAVRAYYQFTKYVEDGDLGHTVGSKVQLTFGAWRPYAVGSVRADTTVGPTSITWTAGIGLTRTL